jgi:Tol biopolymer transport system component
MLLNKPLVLRGLMTCLAGFLALAVGSTEARAASKICFTSQETGDSEIFIMDSDGSNVLNLTANPSSDEFYCSWSPNGTQVAFVSDQDGDAEIYRVDADGSNETRLTYSTGNDLSPAWSPDGTLIAFSSWRDGNMEIYVMNASDGSNPTRLTFNDSPPYASIDYGPSWSPDGTQIAFQSYRNRTCCPVNGNIEIYKMDADGSNQTRLTNNTAADLVPTWSPDGTLIAYTSDITGDSEIWVMDTDGLNQMNLTNNPAQDSMATWSPDASEIAFGSDRAGSEDIFVMDAANGGNQTALTSNAFDDETPDWSSGLSPAVPAISARGQVVLVLLLGGIAAFGVMRSPRKSPLGPACQND